MSDLPSRVYASLVLDKMKGGKAWGLTAWRQDIFTVIILSLYGCVYMLWPDLQPLTHFEAGQPKTLNGFKAGQFVVDLPYDANLLNQFWIGPTIFEASHRYKLGRNITTIALFTHDSLTSY